MKKTTKLFRILLALVMLAALSTQLSDSPARSMEVMAQPKSSGVRIDATNFPDANFREHVRQYDEDEDGILQQTELDAVATMNCSSRNGKLLQI